MKGNRRGDDQLIIYLLICIMIMVMMMAFNPRSEFDQPVLGTDREVGYFIIQYSVRTYYHTYEVDLTNLRIDVDTTTYWFSSHEELNGWLYQSTMDDKEAVDNLIQMMTNYCDYENTFHKQVY